MTQPANLDVQNQVLALVRDLVKREIEPVAAQHDLEDSYPTRIFEQLRALGLMGCTVPEIYGGMALDPVTLAMVMEELAKGWMSVSTSLTSHLTMANLVNLYGTEEQRQRFLPSMASGERFGGVALTEPNCGTDLAAIETHAVRDGDSYVVNGGKLMITNGASGNTFALLVKTDRAAQPKHRGISILIAEKGPGFTTGRHLDKLGFRGVDTVELIFQDYHMPVTSLLGVEEGKGFYQIMQGLEGGRINIASSAVGVAQAAFERAIAYAQQRHTMGVPIAQHQAIQLLLADMYTQVQAARLLVRNAAEKKARGERCDLEAGMAKLFASEVCGKVTLDAMRVHGGYGYFKENVVERYYRDAPLTILGEGSNEMQRVIITKGLLQRYPIA